MFEVQRACSGRTPGRASALQAMLQPSAAAPSHATCRVHENTPICQLLAGHLALQPGAAAKHHALREYREAGQDQLTLLLRKERTPVSRA